MRKGFIGHNLSELLVMIEGGSTGYKWEVYWSRMERSLLVMNRANLATIDE